MRVEREREEREEKKGRVEREGGREHKRIHISPQKLSRGSGKVAMDVHLMAEREIPRYRERDTQGDTEAKCVCVRNDSRERERERESTIHNPVHSVRYTLSALYLLARIIA
jgi:hypothetical protein